MITLIKNIDILAPEDKGNMDILIGGGQILSIEKDLNLIIEHMQTIDGSDKIALPGFIDSHVHICGGGGEGGFKTRTPELKVTNMIKSGVTTVVGCIGTDGFSRTMTNLIAKAKSLKEEGVTAYAYTGSYQVPVKTLTSGITEDIMMIEEIIGTGEIAINDHRSSHGDQTLYNQVFSASRLGGILSRKSGIVNVHLGDGDDLLGVINRCLDETQVPITQFLPTHGNRNPQIFDSAYVYLKKGGYIDFTTSTTQKFIEEGEVPASKAFAEMIHKGIPPTHMTFSSDGQGSLPRFNDSGELLGLDIAKQSSLFKSVLELVENHKLPLDTAILPITLNPAKILKLKGKGMISTGYDADLVLIDKHTYEIDTVISKGNVMMLNKELVIEETFQD